MIGFFIIRPVQKLPFICLPAAPPLRMYSFLCVLCTCHLICSPPVFFVPSEQNCFFCRLCCRPSGLEWGWKKTHTARTELKCVQWAEEGNDLSNDPKQRVKLGCREWDCLPITSTSPSLVPSPARLSLNCCFWGFGPACARCSVRGAPSPPWLQAPDKALILYLSPGSRCVSTDARILTPSFHSIRSLGLAWIQKA